MYELPKKPDIKIKTKQPDKRHFAVIPIDVLSKNLTAGQYRALIALASYCNKAGFSYVSTARLGQDLGISQQGVSYQLKKLENKGVIKTFKNYYPGLKGSTRRIIYSDKISDKEAAAIAGEPAEPYTNVQMRNMLRNKRLNNINALEPKVKGSSHVQSIASNSEILASLVLSVSEPHVKAMIKRDYAKGIPIDIIKARYIKA